MYPNGQGTSSWTGTGVPSMIPAQGLGQPQSFVQTPGFVPSQIPQTVTTGFVSPAQLSQFGTPPQLVQQHIQQDLSQAYRTPGAYGQAGIPVGPTGFIAHGQAQIPYNPGVLQQVMNSVQTNPQWIRSQIQQDIQQGLQNQAYASQMPIPTYTQTVSPTGYTSGVLSQFGTNPALVRSHIQQDLSQSHALPQAAQPVLMGGVAPGYSSQATSGAYGASTLAQFGTHPQVVQEHIRQDLGYLPQQPVGTFGTTLY